MDAGKQADFLSFVHDDGKGSSRATRARMYGQGRVFYTTLGHVEANRDKPEMQAMIVGAINWALKLVDADATARPAPQ